MKRKGGIEMGFKWRDLLGDGWRDFTVLALAALMLGIAAGVALWGLTAWLFD